MKKIFINSFLLVFILAMFSACSKYDDGPWISFRSKAERLHNEWKVAQLKIYLNDTTIAWKTYYDWVYSFNMPDNSGEGTMNLYAPKPFCSVPDSGGINGYGSYHINNDFTSLSMMYWFVDPNDSLQTVGDSCGIWPLVTQQEITFEITRLKSRELWLRYQIDSEEYVIIKFEEN